MRRLVLVPLWAIACFSEPPIADSCHVGAKGCDCHPDQSCDGALVCEPSIHKCIAADCVAGAELCPCGPSDGCFGGLVCTDGLCQMPGQDTVAADGTAVTNASEPTGASASNGTSGSVDSTVSSVGETVPMTSDATTPVTETEMSASGPGSSDGDSGSVDCLGCVGMQRDPDMGDCAAKWTACMMNECVELASCLLDDDMSTRMCCPAHGGQTEWNAFLVCANQVCNDPSCMPSAQLGCP